MILETLFSEIRTRLAGRVVSDVRIGLGFTAVLLDDEKCGLASTLPQDPMRGCSVLNVAGELINKKAVDLLDLVDTSNSVSVSLGVATANACLNTLDSSEPDPGIQECINLKDAVVGLVGHIAPLVPTLKESAAKLYVFDRRPISPDVLGEEDAKKLIPTCDVVIFTSQTIVNGTADHLLSIAQNTVALMGPTTPMWDGFKNLGVSHLFGRVVREPSKVLEVVSQAGGTRRFGPSLPKVYRGLMPAR